MPATGSNPSPAIKSIRISADGLSFFGDVARSIRYDRPDTRYARSVSYCLCAPELRDTDPATVWVATPACMPLPAGLFGTDDAARLLRWQYPGTDIRDVRSERLREGITVAYALSPDLSGFLEERFPEARVSHPDIPLISHLTAETARGQMQALYLHPQGGYCAAAWADRGLLTGYNRFAVTSADDLLYYTGTVLRAMRLPQAEARVTLFEDNACLQALQERLPKLQYQPLPPCAL